MQDTQAYEQQSALVHELVANTLQPNNHELLRHLGEVLAIKAQDQVLLIGGSDSDAAQRALIEAFDCQVDVFTSELGALPYASGQFHSVIVMVPLTKHLHAVARELSRVLKPTGSLGMVIFSVYRDQMPEASDAEQIVPLIDTARPAAVYRAVLAECGFTAFVTKDRRRDLRRSALESYREHMLHTSADAVQAPVSASQVLGLLASGSVSVVLITAEKGM